MLCPVLLVLSMRNTGDPGFPLMVNTNAAVKLIDKTFALMTRTRISVGRSASLAMIEIKTMGLLLKLTPATGDLHDCWRRLGPLTE